MINQNNGNQDPATENNHSALLNELSIEVETKVDAGSPQVKNDPTTDNEVVLEGNGNDRSRTGRLSVLLLILSIVVMCTVVGICTSLYFKKIRSDANAENGIVTNTNEVSLPEEQDANDQEVESILKRLVIEEKIVNEASSSGDSLITESAVGDDGQEWSETEMEQQKQYFGSLGNRIIVGGNYIAEDQIEFDHWYLQVNDGIATITPGEYSFEYLDAQGSRLYSLSVDRSYFLDEAQKFGFIIPYPDNTKTVSLLYNDKFIASKTRSDHEPVITSVEPDDGADANLDVTLNWDASDADGDALMYTIIYSDSTDFSNYNVLVENISASEYTFPASSVNAGLFYYIIHVSDGFNSNIAGPRSITILHN